MLMSGVEVIGVMKIHEIINLKEKSEKRAPEEEQ
jgi:hypothetical protein